IRRSPTKGYLPPGWRKHLIGGNHNSAIRTFAYAEPVITERVWRGFLSGQLFLSEQTETHRRPDDDQTDGNRPQATTHFSSPEWVHHFPQRIPAGGTSTKGDSNL